MSLVTTSASLTTLLALVAFAPGVAHAQEPRIRLAASAAAATIEGEAELALAGSIAYRFARGFWFEGELTWIDEGSRASGNLAIPGPLPIPDQLPGGHGADGSIPIAFDPIATTRERTTLIGTIGLRYELPVETERFRPYLAGGLGINQTDEALRVEGLDTVLEDTSHTGYAFNAGAGVSVRLVRQLWADLDARYFRLSRDRNSMRLGGGLSVRF